MKPGVTPDELSPILVKAAVEAALAEDLGLAGDVTTNATIKKGSRAEAVIATRGSGVISGVQIAEAAFRMLDPDISFEVHVRDGSFVDGATTLVTVSGNARAILTAERVALNYMGRMSGIATLTKQYCNAVLGTKAKIVDTRKTTPGLRVFEKYAVRCGGGHNHRSGLFDAILIKDNHIVAAGGISAAITAAQAAAGHVLKIEVEVDTLEQLDEILKHKIDVVLLDNMTPIQLKAAVARVAGRLLTEASGGVNLATVKAVAETGVDLISVGALTHSAPLLDLGLDFKPLANASRRTIDA